MNTKVKGCGWELYFCVMAVHTLAGKVKRLCPLSGSTPVLPSTDDNDHIGFNPI